MDNIIKKQLLLENLLKTTNNTLKVWIKNFIVGVISYEITSNLLDQRIKELTK